VGGGHGKAGAAGSPSRSTQHTCSRQELGKRSDIESAYFLFVCNFRSCSPHLFGE